MTSREQYTNLMKQDIEVLRSLAKDLDLAVPVGADKTQLVSLLMGECPGCPQAAQVNYLFKGAKTVYNGYTFTPKPAGGPCLTCPQ